ncbi:Hsp70 family protein [Pseudonocardia sp. N23]|uniref:Hsp70 family protein n=1 Tax=Pseudonocardia sp. N23 TaxID=1987376 RepID=UPI000BFB8A17|nr:Hsp70 family protein [Pseudonocardia sp. N23]
MSYLLGIDVGTTRTAAAITRLDGGRIVETEMVNLGDRSVHVPSVLFIGADGGVVVGEAAERRALTDPDRVVREFKRRVGDPTPIHVAGQPWTPEDLSARLVRWVVDQVAAREGGVADRISVTHPASWGGHKKELFAGALARVGLTVTFLAEPQAAALHYASSERVEQGATIAVYDLGGGTFDAAVVRKDGNFGLLGRPEGLERLGGIDFDQVVFDHVVEGMPDAFADLDEADPAVLSAVARIRRDCTEAKEALSSDTEASVAVMLPGSQGSVRLHRSEFEQMIGPQIDETVAALGRAIASAGLTPDETSAVLLVGGSSRIPLVAQTVSEEFGRPVAVDADPKNAIAKGAAIALAPQQPVAPPAPGGNGTGGHPAHGGPPPGMGAAALGAGALGAAAMGAAAMAHSPATDELPTVDVRRIAASGGYHPPVAPPPPPPRDGTPMAGPGGYGDPYASPDLDRDAPPRRTPVLLVAAGGVLAALGVIAAVLFWPQSNPTSAANTRIVPSEAVTTTEAAPTTTEVPPETESSRNNVPPPVVRTTTKVVPPPVTSTKPPVTSSVPPPVTSSPPPPVTSSPPPPVTTAP